jgi:PKD repeat protein
MIAGQTVNAEFTLVRIAPPVAAFSGTPTSGVASLPVTFKDESTGTPTGWAWFFGDEPWTAPWTQVTASPVWPARYAHTAVAMPDGSIVIMGGLDNSDNLLNDVWQSTDIGASWLQMKPNDGNGWPARSDFSSVALPDGSIVVMGGTGLTRDVWRSTDNGASWLLQTASAGWSGRNEHSSVAMPDGSIVLMGGWDGFNAQNDVWRSTDKGATWELKTANAGWSGRSDHSSVAMPDGSIIVMGGVEPGPHILNDVWRSTDNGQTWELRTANAGWAPRAEFGSVAMPDGSIIVMGGAGYNDVWRSTDNGATWTRLTYFAGWTPRHLFSAVAMRDGSIVLMGGDDPSYPGYLNDVWRFPLVGSSEHNPSHTYTSPGTYSVALQAYNDGGYSSIRQPGYITVMAVTQEQAVDIAKAKAGTTTGKEGVSASRNSLSARTTVQTMRGSSSSPNYGTWLVSINHNPRANLESRFTNYYVYNDQVVSSEEVWSPPLNIGMTNDLNGNPGDPGSNGPAPTESSTCSYVTCDNCYALLISGGYNPENNHIRYWYDMSSMYQTLRQKYCYPKDHIYVLMSDGINPANDRRSVSPTGETVYDSSPLDLDGKGGDDVRGEATKTNIVETLTNPDKLGKLTAADTLFIFTTNHGGKDPSGGPRVRLWLWQGDYIWDDEFAALLNNVKANTITMTMEQCYSGGFVDDFMANAPQTQTRVIATAASALEPSYGNDFSYHWISGVAGPADTNGIGDKNGQISMWEGFDYANKHDPSALGGDEHPQYGDVSQGSGESQSLSSCSKVVCSPQPNPIPIPTLPGSFYPAPNNPDNPPDCIIYEDLNGDGKFDSLDVILFFNQMEWIANPANEPVISGFDANRNGRIDFADIVKLYGKLPVGGP